MQLVFMIFTAQLLARNRNASVCKADAIRVQAVERMNLEHGTLFSKFLFCVIRNRSHIFMQ